MHKGLNKNLLWLQSGGCGGCSLSLFNAESPDLLTALECAGIELLWHPSLSEQSGSEMLAMLESIERGDTPLHLLCLEGSVIRGPNGSGLFHRLAGSDRAMKDWLQLLSERAEQVLAVGTCAAFGGITGGGGNGVDACGLQYEGSRPGGLLGDGFQAQGGLPVINIAGCPTHPNWVVETLIQVARGEFSRKDMDELGRPRSYADHLVHHGCPRNEYYEFKASAEKPSDLGCMMEHMAPRPTPTAIPGCGTATAPVCVAGMPASTARRRASKRLAITSTRPRRSPVSRSVCPPICRRPGSWLWPRCPRRRHRPA